MSEETRWEVRICRRDTTPEERSTAQASKVTEVLLTDRQGELPERTVQKNLEFPGNAFIIKVGLVPGERHLWVWEVASCFGDTEYSLMLYPTDPSSGRRLLVNCHEAMDEDYVRFDLEGKCVYSKSYHYFGRGDTFWYRYEIDKGEGSTVVSALPDESLVTLRGCRQWSP